MQVPLTDDGERHLQAELGRADERVNPPAEVWVFDTDTCEEVRASLYGWRQGPLPYALVVRHLPGAVDRILWICSPFIRPRRE
jgi:hypothetical protein